MEPARLLPGLVASLLLGLVIFARLLVWRRRLPPDFAGQVKADIAQAMLRAMLVLLAGLALWLGLAAGWLPRAAPVQWIALVLAAIGGVGVIARAALYWLRIKPALDSMSTPAVPASPAIDLQGNGMDEG